MTTTTRGFTQPIALLVGLLFCIVVGYALVKGFSHQSAVQAGEPLVVESGERLDAPVRKADPIRPDLPEAIPAATMLSAADLADGHTEISFAKLANYEYIYPDPDDPKPLGDQIPDSVRALDKSKVALQGFMLPVKMDGDRVTEFLLMKDQSACCFGVWPGMNEWVHVLLPDGETCEWINDMPITVFGTLRVGEYYEKEVLLGIYRLDYHKLIGPR